MQQDSVSLRLKEYLSVKGMNAKDFERITGLGNGTAARLSNSTRQTTYDRIAKSAIDLNPEWLRTGEGKMLKTPEANATLLGAAQSAQSESAAAVRFFEVRPTATFQEFCAGSAEGISTIEVIPQGNERLDDSYCVFQVTGDSMAPQIQNRARVLCQEVLNSKWFSLDNCVVVIAYADKFVIKRIVKNHLQTEDWLRLASDNPDYPEQQTVWLADIRCIFRAKRVISSDII